MMRTGRMKNGRGPQHSLAAVVARTGRQWVRLSRGCNNRCFFCHDAGARNGTFTPAAEVFRVIRRAAREGQPRLVLSGGEPTLHPRFVEIVAYARRQGIGHIQVITNGRMFAYEDFFQAAVEAGLSEITFSLHGHEAALHDALTAAPGSFDQALRGLGRALERPEMVVSLDIVLCRSNLRRLREIIAFFRLQGVREFDLLYPIPFGDAWKNRRRIFFGGQEARRHLHPVLAWARRYPGMHVWTNRFPPALLEGFEEFIQDPVKLFDEVGGRAHLFAAAIRRGTALSCRGARCGYCFLRAFCEDLAVLRRTGVLPARPVPACLAEARVAGAPPVFRRRGKEADLFSLVQFFITHRYFGKSSLCRACPLEKMCAGAPYTRVREKAFAHRVSLFLSGRKGGP